MTERGEGQDGEQLQPDRHMQLDRPFDAKAYQHNQLNQIVQSVQIPPVSESRAALDSSIYVTERGEGQDGEQLQPDRYMEPHRSFDAKTYQHNQLNKMIQGVKSIQIPPVSESRAVLDPSIYVTEREEGQDGEQLQPDRHMQLDRPFDAKTYQHNQLNQIVQSIQIPPVSESREVLDP